MNARESVHAKTRMRSGKHDRYTNGERTCWNILGFLSLLVAGLFAWSPGYGETDTPPLAGTRTPLLPRGLTLARGGRTDYAVVQGKTPTEAESFAAKELADHLEKVTGAEFPLVTEGEPLPRTNGIYVGWTKFAAKEGVDPSELGAEEWILRAAADNLILTGGRPRGTLYAVYEFLESEVGCLWLDRDTEVVPFVPDLTVAGLGIRGKPAFWWRGYYGGFFTMKPDNDVRARERLFRVRNKGNSQDAGVNRAQFGFEENTGSPGGCHTFFAYVDPKVWFEKHPEYFADDGTGNRTCGNADRVGASGSQLCLTNPDVRKIVVEQLRRFIARDSEAARKRGAPPPRVYDISQEDDAPHMCLCPTCKALIEREGSESGPVVDFINAIADAIRDEYPEILLQTFAYVSTEKPPRTLKPRGNVIIRLCDLYTKSEAVRPLTHPFNRDRADLIRGWGRIAEHLVVWDYWHYSGHASPDVHTQTIQPDFAFFHENRVEGLFLEAEERDPRQSFYALGCWLGHKLMQDPYQPVEPLIDAFLNGYCGPAAPKVKEWLRYVEGRIAANPDKIVLGSKDSRRHWDLDFFVTAERLLQAAEDACPPGSLYRLHVQIERVPILAKLLALWPTLEGAQAAKRRPFPFDRKDVVDRYETLWRAEIAACRSKAWGEKLLAELPGNMSLLRNPPPLPKSLGNVSPHRVTEFFWPSFQVYHTEIVPDPEAAGGKALRLTTADHNKPLSFGLYDRTRKVSGPTVVLKPWETPRDEKYHLYKIGRFRVGPGVIVWAHGSWLLCCPIDRAYRPADGLDPSVNDWNVHISLKVTGPAYVKGSTQPNAVWQDRVILVKP